MEEPMWENIEGFEFERDGDFVFLKFHDLFGEGSTYIFHIDEVETIRDALTELIESQ